MKLDKPYLGALLFCAALNFFPVAMPMTSHIDEHKSAVFLSFPLELGGWKGKDVKVDERTYEILETRNVLSRMYEDANGRQMHLLLVGSYKDRRVAHPPEVCYISSNFVILNESQDSLAVQGTDIPVKEFLARNERNPNDQEQVLYLYKVGDRFTTNYYSQQLQFAMDRMTNKVTQILLIRLAIPSHTGKMSPQLKKSFEEFLALVLAELKTAQL